MILMNQGAINALEDQAFDEGIAKGRQEASDEYHVFLREQKRLVEILEVEGDQSLVEAADHLYQEVRAHREAMKVAAFQLEKQREKISEQQRELAMHKESLLTMSLALDQQHNEIRDQREKINELRQSLLQHVKETA